MLKALPVEVPPPKPSKEIDVLVPIIGHHAFTLEKAHPVLADTSIIEERHSLAVDHEVRLDSLFGTRGQVEVVHLLRLRCGARSLLHDHHESVQTRELPRGRDGIFGRVPWEKVLRVLMHVEIDEHTLS